MQAMYGYWLPLLPLETAQEYWELAGDGITLRVPRLTVAQVRELTHQLCTAQRDYLSCLPVDVICERIGAAVNRWLEPFSPYLHAASTLLPAFTGFPEAAIRKGLAGYLASFRQENLRRLLDEELGNAEVLDRFVSRSVVPGLVRAIGPRLTFHSFSGNTPGLPAQSLVAAMLVKSASLGKSAAEEPLFAALFAESLGAVDTDLGRCLAVTYWPGSELTIDSSVARTAMDEAEVVVAYGGSDAIAGVRAAIGKQRFLAYGHKLSFGMVTREVLVPSLLDELVERAAYDVVKFDQQGCLSPHVFYVEEGGTVGLEAFAERLAKSLARWEQLMPRGRLTVVERQRLAETVRQHEFRVARGEGKLWGGASAGWAVLVSEDPAFEASCLNRVVWLKPLRDAEELKDLLVPVREFLQTAGVSTSEERLPKLLEELAQLGLDRICPLGQMGDPPVTWHHDGRFNVLDFLRFIDWEPEIRSGQWEFKHPTRGVLGLPVTERSGE